MVRVGRDLWHTAFLLVGRIIAGTVFVGGVDRLYACILFLVFAGGVIILVFYTARLSSR